MILVDTSVWIDFFNGIPSIEADTLANKITTHDALCINGIIEMELLQGVKSEQQFRQLKNFLRPFQYFPTITQNHISLSILVYRKCRSKGRTIRKSIDCLIAATALAEGLTILHKDRDFTEMARTISDLKVWNLH